MPSAKFTTPKAASGLRGTRQLLRCSRAPARGGDRSASYNFAGYKQLSPCSYSPGIMAKRLFVARWRRVSRTPQMPLNCVQGVASPGALRSIRWSPDLKPRWSFCMVDKSMTGTFQINLPKDLLSEAKRQPKLKNEQLKVEGWRTSWLSKVSEMLVGKD